jgi:hypothetical protein
MALLEQQPAILAPLGSMKLAQQELSERQKLPVRVLSFFKTRRHAVQGQISRFTELDVRSSLFGTDLKEVRTLSESQPVIFRNKSET